ncbi:MAG TPA: hypothetical protein VFX86_02695 [Candidatus Saccharimonadales bacterium]|nr:hypothetical protein [Candidatus Saccharimonadales bacterium]
MFDKIFPIFLVGISILAVALALNFLAGKAGVNTWYDFVKEPGSTNLISYLWLFIIYPFALGLTAYLILKLLDI